jgi:hypothetical protein
MNKVYWPELPLEKWIETYDMLHLLFQIAGKIKLQFTQYKNHWWNISFIPTVTGFSTGIIPYEEKCFEIDFDFHSHKIFLRFNDGGNEYIELQSGTIQSYYKKIKEKLLSFDCKINLWPVPVEMEYRIPFNKDDKHRIYSPESSEKFHRIILLAGNVMEFFRSGFSGKASPVHFFWGSFDLAVTFFSGRPAPEHAGAPNVGKDVMVKAYNSELASFGFWPGKGFGEPAFYAYCYPEPEKYKDYKIEPQEAFYHKSMGEFILPYNAIIKYENPRQPVLAFLKSSFRAAEKSGDWDKNLAAF